MTLNDAISEELPFLRAEAEALMVDTGTALRPTGGYVYDPNANGGTGGEVLATETLFSGPCKVQTRTLQAQAAEVGGRTAVTVRMELHLPADSPALTTGDLWEFTAVHPLSLARVGQQVRVVAPVAGTFKTAARYEVEEVVS